MANKLLIVESPAKAKTISKYLAYEFKVLASFGHVRDLPKKNGSIDVDNNFAPNFQLIAKNKVHVDEIIKAAKQADTIFLASDQDREGEAIAWHIQQILQQHGLLANKTVARVTFNEITKPAILEAIQKPRQIDVNLVDAQLSRLTLDYLIGFNVSPLLWRKIKPGLSAGRVQSPALRLICEREAEIQQFIPEDYFAVHLFTQKQQQKFSAKLIEYAGQKIETKTIKLKNQAEEILADLVNIKQTEVLKITKKQKKKNPSAPFITSSLQIDASRQLGFATDKTMKIAQTLYEGVELNHEMVGLITYMRTDSVQLSSVAIEEIREYISNNFTDNYLPAKPNTYTSKAKNAQEAHEAIRPTSILRTPELVKPYLTADQFKLYELIWRRTLACQISPAILDTTAINLKLASAIFRANGVMINFDGFMKVYQETNEDNLPSDEQERHLPDLVEGEFLPVNELDISQHQTEAKPRYSEASLVKSLEELGIGRPSTLVSIILTLKKREYVQMDKKRFIPTEVGTIVNQFLTTHLSKYVDYEFTAKLEDTLDEIAIGRKLRLPELQHFWQELDATINDKQNISKLDVVSEVLEENCPSCGKHLISRFGRYGRFIGCSGYPECSYMRKLGKDGSSEEVLAPEEVPDRVCPKDGGKLLIRSGKYGKFISCANYPKCKHLENIDAPEASHALHCPECNKGKIMPRKGRFGMFYSCNNYPECKTIYKYEPIQLNCSACQYPLMMQHTTKTKGAQYICPKCKHCESTNEQ
jgi:DNA topoisomerase-1